MVTYIINISLALAANQGILIGNLKCLNGLCYRHVGQEKYFLNYIYNYI